MSPTLLETGLCACPALITLTMEVRRSLKDDKSDVSALTDVPLPTNNTLERPNLELSLADFFYVSEMIEPIDPLDLTILIRS